MRWNAKLSIMLVAWVTVATLGAEEKADTRAAVPAKAAREAALATIADVHKADYKAATTPAKKAELARTMLREAQETKDDLPARFALANEAANLATKGGDLELAITAYDLLAADFQVDVLPLEVTSLEQCAKGASGEVRCRAILASANRLIGKAVARDRYDLAVKIGDATLTPARALGPNMVKVVTLRNGELGQCQAAFAQVLEAKKKLEESPADPAANLAVGRYYALLCGKWERGVPMLALGADPALKKAAGKELAGAKVADEQVALGDEWLGAAAALKALEKQNAQAHAIYWYEQALPYLQGLKKSRVERAIKDATGPQIQVPQTARIHFLGPIDGRDRLTIRATGAEWTHESWSWPGVVQFNGQAWTPESKRVLPFNEETVKGFGKIDFASAELKKLRGRGGVALEKRDDSVTIIFDDGDGGADTYEVVLALRTVLSFPAGPK